MMRVVTGDTTWRYVNPNGRVVGLICGILTIVMPLMLINTKPGDWSYHDTIAAALTPLMPVLCVAGFLLKSETEIDKEKGLAWHRLKLLKWESGQDADLAEIDAVTVAERRVQTLVQTKTLAVVALRIRQPADSQHTEIQVGPYRKAAAARLEAHALADFLGLPVVVPSNVMV